MECRPASRNSSYHSSFILESMRRRSAAYSFFNLVRERSVRKLFRMIQTIEVGRVKDRAAELLQVGDGHPALVMHRVFIDSEERPVAYIRLYGRDGKYQVHTEFEKIK